jgi:heterodisulfide reductase subunit B2
LKYGFYPGCSYKSAAGYSQSVDRVSRALGHELVEIDDWNCCGATTYWNLDKMKGLTLAARVFALADEQGLGDVVTVCNACYNTLRKTRDYLFQDAELKNEVEGRLAEEGLGLPKNPVVRHYLEVLVNDVPAETWAGKIQSPSRILFDPAVAGYYGCQLTRPWGDVDHAERPSLLERLIETLKLEPIRHSAQTLCCGAALAVPHKEACRPLMGRIIQGVRQAGATSIVTICPLCQFNLDSGQEGSSLPPTPVLYFTQLVGLAMGMSPRDLGLDKLLVPVEGLQ